MEFSCERFVSVLVGSFIGALIGLTVLAIWYERIYRLIDSILVKASKLWRRIRR